MSQERPKSTSHFQEPNPLLAFRSVADTVQKLTPFMKKENSNMIWFEFKGYDYNLYAALPPNIRRHLQNSLRDLDITISQRKISDDKEPNFSFITGENYIEIRYYVETPMIKLIIYPQNLVARVINCLPPITYTNNTQKIAETLRQQFWDFQATHPNPPATNFTLPTNFSTFSTLSRNY